MNLKRIIREEMDDIWQHLTQGEPNIWISYQLLVFDEEPTKKEVIKFIKDAFKSGLVKNDAIRTWELEGIEDEAETIYEYAQKGTRPYLRIDLNTGWLFYGEYYSNLGGESSKLKTIKFSEAKNYLMRESTGLEWITKTDPNEMTFRVGDVIQVHNVGNKKSFLNWLGDFEHKYTTNVYGKNITGRIYNLNSTRIKIEELITGDHITFPTYSDMKNINEVYKGLNLLYELLNTEY